MLIVKYGFKCDAVNCSEGEDFEYETQFGYTPMTPILPFGWDEIGHKIYCSRHTVVLDIVDKEQPMKLLNVDTAVQYEHKPDA